MNAVKVLYGRSLSSSWMLLCTDNANVRCRDGRVSPIFTELVGTVTIPSPQHPLLSSPSYRYCSRVKAANVASGQRIKKYISTAINIRQRPCYFIAPQDFYAVTSPFWWQTSKDPGLFFWESGCSHSCTSISIVFKRGIRLLLAASDGTSAALVRAQG